MIGFTPEETARTRPSASVRARFAFLGLIGARSRMARLLVVALLCGCHGEHEHGPDEHGPDEHGPGEHGHDEHEGASEAITRWGTTTQLFVEFPALVVGEPSAFAAHLTRLQDHAALDHGSLVVELHGGGHPVERFVVDAPTVPGIFRPIITPTHAGTRSLTLRYDSPELSETHELGELMVFTTRELADAAAADEEEGPTISYLLEQQWKVEFSIERVELRDLRPSVPAFARLTSPPDAASSVTAPRDGRIVAHGDRFLLVGDEVEAGVVLFGLGMAPEDRGDPASLDLAVEQAKIEVQAAQREVDRLAPLVEQGVVATRRLDEANSALASANAQLRSARRRARSLGQSQRVGAHATDHLDVPSPISGAVAELLVAPGAWVGEGQPLARIVSRDRLWLDVSVPDAYVGQLGEVSGAWFQLAGVESVIELPTSALVSVGIEVDPQTRTLPVRFHVDNSQRELFAGMTTQAHVIVDRPRSSAAVPIAAVVDDAGSDVVYVQTGGESFERRPVELGIRDGDYVEVREGVAAGEWVVGRGAYSVKLASSSTAAIGHGHAH
jgi:cobalt-zinc-cadmium efflux system membrane fusion protein